jgi:hypothetical protein
VRGSVSEHAPGAMNKCVRSYASYVDLCVHSGHSPHARLSSTRAPPDHSCQYPGDAIKAVTRATLAVTVGPNGRVAVRIRTGAQAATADNGAATNPASNSAAPPPTTKGDASAQPPNAPSAFAILTRQYTTVNGCTVCVESATKVVVNDRHTCQKNKCSVCKKKCMPRRGAHTTTSELVDLIKHWSGATLCGHVA